MIMTSFKTAARQDDAIRIPAPPACTTVMQATGPEAAHTRDITSKSKAWWDLVANMIVGRR